MAYRADDSQQDIADLQRDRDDTWSALSAKLELLGERVQETVAGAQTTVAGIGETVEAVQRTFDLPYQMEQRPWLLLSGATVVGYLLGSLSSGQASAALSPPDPRVSPLSPSSGSSRESSTPAQAQAERGWGDLGRLPDEMAALKSAAVGAVMSILWGMVKQALLSPTPPSASDMTKQGPRSRQQLAPPPVALSSTAVNGGAIL